MADTEPQELSPLTPVPLAALLCDQVISDATTKKKTIVGIFDRIYTRNFPTTYSPASLYIRVIDAEGHYVFRMEFVQVTTQTKHMEATIEVHIPSRQTAAEFALRLPVIPLPEPGEYEFRLWANEKYIHRVRFIADTIPS